MGDIHRDKPYICMDIDLPTHERIVNLSDPARGLGLWAAMTAHTRQQLKDGHVPKRLAIALWGDKRNAKLLTEMVAVGLLIEHEATYELYKYAPRNQTKAMVEAAKEKARTKMAAWRAERDKKRRVTELVTGNETGSLPLSPTSTSDLSSLSSPASAPSPSLAQGETGSGVIAVAPLALVPSGGRKPKPRPNRTPEVQAVFDHWAAESKRRHPRRAAVLDDGRASVIAARLADGCSVEILKLAVEGIWRSAWHLGQNDRGREYTDIGIALRDAKHVEELAETALKSRELDATKGQAG